MSADFYEDLANEMGDPTRTRYLQPDEEEEEQTMSKLIVHQFREFKREPLLSEDYFIGRSQSIYQGPSHHENMDSLRETFRQPVIVVTWKTLLGIGLVLFAGAVVAMVAILRDLQP
jgi:hypothetical protein